jgi:8-oxo-dGTP pyrophosphatase MutT (NUDIX family)
MPKIEKSAGAIIFRKENGKIFYLLLYYPSLSHRAEKNFWDFPKGHIEKGENEIDTIKREIFEETGIKEFKILDGFKEKIKYFFRWQGKTILKFVTFYLAETKEKEVKISPEHIDWRWADFETALSLLTHQNSKEILKKAHSFLERKNKS